MPCIRRRLRKKVYKRDNGKCAYCNKSLSFTEATLDHIVPKKLGGRIYYAGNTVISCEKCNLDKGIDDIRLYCIIHPTQNEHLKRILSSEYNISITKLYKKKYEKEII